MGSMVRSKLLEEAADEDAYEAFLTNKLTGLPGVLRTTSHLTMKKIKADGVAMPQSSLAKRRQP